MNKLPKSKGLKELLSDKNFCKKFKPLTLKQLRDYLLKYKPSPTFKIVKVNGNTWSIQEPLNSYLPKDTKNFDPADFKLEILDFGKNEQQEK